MKLSQSVVAVTGATGFLGGYLVDALLARGARVVAVVRNLDKAKPLAVKGAELRSADLANRGALQAAFQGVDAVISNAAVIAFTKPRETTTTNVEGTRNVFEALAAASVKRAIAVSSASAYVGSLRKLDERAPLRAGRLDATLQAYGESKAAAELVARQICERNAIDLTIFRPCGITGPSDPLLMRTLKRFMGPRIVPFPAFTHIGVVHAADVAEAICNALERPAISRDKAYNLQGNTVTLWEMANAWKAAGGRTPWLRIPVPVPVSLRFDDALARNELDFRPRDVRVICREVLALAGKPDGAL